jgi:hypothetical protein
VFALSTAVREEKYLGDEYKRYNADIEQFNEIANEYLQREFGREVKGGSSMTWTEFETQSYAKDRTEVQINVVINYDKKTITLSHR